MPEPSHWQVLTVLSTSQKLFPENGWVKRVSDATILLNESRMHGQMQSFDFYSDCLQKSFLWVVLWISLNISCFYLQESSFPLHSLYCFPQTWAKGGACVPCPPSSATNPKVPAAASSGTSRKCILLLCAAGEAEVLSCSGHSSWQRSIILKKPFNGIKTD